MTMTLDETLRSLAYSFSVSYNDLRDLANCLNVNRLNAYELLEPYLRTYNSIDDILQSWREFGRPF